MKLTLDYMIKRCERFGCECIIDKFCIDLGQYHYSVALEFKPKVELQSEENIVEALHEYYHHRQNIKGKFNLPDEIIEARAEEFCFRVLAKLKMFYELEKKKNYITENWYETALMQGMEYDPHHKAYFILKNKGYFS